MWLVKLYVHNYNHLAKLYSPNESIPCLFMCPFLNYVHLIKLYVTHLVMCLIYLGVSFSYEPHLALCLNKLWVCAVDASKDRIKRYSRI